MLRSALVADEIKDAVPDDRGVHQKGQKVTYYPALREIAEEQIDHKGLPNGATTIASKRNHGRKAASLTNKLFRFLCG